MNTVTLHDANLSGYVIIHTEDSPEDTAAWLAERSGLWTDYGATTDGMILTSEEWSADYYTGVELTEADFMDSVPYPNYRLEGTDTEPYWQCEEA